MARGDKTDPIACSVEADRKSALDLRITGMSYRAIAAQRGCSVGKAYEDVSTALAKLKAECAEKAEEVRKLELDRIDVMLKGIWPDAENGDARKIETELKLMERRAKLLGIDAPTKQEVSGPDGGAIPIEDARAMLADRLAALANPADSGAVQDGSGESA
jgi:hypothetical protein